MQFDLINEDGDPAGFIKLSAKIEPIYKPQKGKVDGALLKVEACVNKPGVLKVQTDGGIDLQEVKPGQISELMVPNEGEELKIELDDQKVKIPLSGKTVSTDLGVFKVTPIKSLLTDKKKGQLELEIDPVEGKSVEVEFDGNKLGDELKVDLNDAKAQLGFTLKDGEGEVVGQKNIKAAELFK